MTLHIPALPGLNTSARRRHWAVQHREAERWKALVWFALIEQGFRRSKEPWPKVRLTITRHSARQPDWDNLVASAKPVVDALKKNGLILDDAPANFVGGHPNYRWEKGKSGITVEIEETP